MELLSKLKYYTTLAGVVLVTVVLIIIVGVLWYQPDTPITHRELRRYIILFFFLFALLIILLLLMRNALIANTAFLIRLRDSMQTVGKSFDGFEKEMRSRGQVEQKAITETKNLTNAVKELTTLIKENDNQSK